MTERGTVEGEEEATAPEAGPRPDAGRARVVVVDDDPDVQDLLEFMFEVDESIWSAAVITLAFIS